MTAPTRCVIDTNVAATANFANEAASPSCAAACARALQGVMSAGHVFVDHAGRIVDEYRRNLRAKGQPGAGDAFLKWILTNEWSGHRVTRVRITAKRGDPDDFDEISTPPAGIRYDPSDRKFLAVAAAHPDHPPILQALDSKWWGWRDALAKAGILVYFVCEGEIAAMYTRKCGR